MADFTAKSGVMWSLEVDKTWRGILLVYRSNSGDPYPGSDYHYEMTMSVAEWRRLSTWVEHQFALADAPTR